MKDFKKIREEALRQQVRHDDVFRKGIPTTLNDRDCRSLMAEIASALPSNFK